VSKERNLLKRITANPELFDGKPIVRGQVLTVEQVLMLLVEGSTFGDVLTAYPGLEQEDILACLDYARRLVATVRLDGLDTGFE
jgi:uncharacterized protein (DUF433 family)